MKTDLPGSESHEGSLAGAVGSRARRRTFPVVGSAGWLAASIQIGAASFYVPLAVLGDHPGYITRDYRLFVLGGVIFCLGMLVVVVVGRWLLWSTATHIVVVTVLGVTAGGRSDGVSLLRTVLVFCLLCAMTVLLIRVRESALVRRLFWWLTITLWLWALVGLVPAALGNDDGVVNSPLASGLRDPDGDVLIVMFDEYPGATFATAALGSDMGALESELVERGFEVSPDIPTNYSVTEIALPSFFLMDLPLEERETLSEKQRGALLGAVGGENPLTQAFVDLGYSVTMVESGWSGQRCMSVVDRCVVRSWFDEVTWGVARRSILNGVISEQFGDPFSVGAERTVSWLREKLPTILADDEDDFIFVHVMLPHTPVAFDAECQRVEGRSVSLGDQIACANKLMLEIADVSEGASIVLMFGDHGTKTLGQMGLPPAEWTQEMVDERMVTFAATAGLYTCEEPPASSVTNLSVRLARCLGATELPYVQDVFLGTSLKGEPLVSMHPNVSTRED